MITDTMWISGLKNAFGYNPLLCKCEMVLNYDLSMFSKFKDDG